ncbi:MAG: hypothetical protein IH927_10425 [Proteobacteria bacterium]|nr:hypothetical protein [Pseudomonadota bacterium]
MQENAAAVVWVMICGVVSVPGTPATGMSSTMASNEARYRDIIMAAVLFDIDDSDRMQPVMQ